MCYCGEYVKGHGFYNGHTAVPTMCLVCDPLIKCPKCGGEESRVYMHQHKCPDLPAPLEAKP